MSHALFPTRRVLWLPFDLAWPPPKAGDRHCCAEMTAALGFRCDVHDDPFDCPDTLLIHHPLFREYGLPIRDGGPSYLTISHCPFCGAALPSSRRDAWFDAVEAAGLEGAAFESLPDRLRATTEWEKKP